MNKTKKLARKSRKPARESLAWYKQSWAEAFKGSRPPAAAVDELARLSYENKRIRQRLETVEKVLVASFTGKVEIQGDMHLLNCDLRDGGASCTCGSKPRDKNSN